MTIQEILGEIGITGKELSEKLGFSYGWYRKATSKGERDRHRWVKAFVMGYEMGIEKKIDASRHGDGSSLRVGGSEIGSEVFRCFSKGFYFDYVKGEWVFFGMDDNEIAILKERYNFIQ